jgi:hypothetical protein
MKVAEEKTGSSGISEAVIITPGLNAALPENSGETDALAIEPTPGLLSRTIHRLLHIPGFSPLALALTFALLTICLALGAWLAAMVMQNRYLQAQLHDQTQNQIAAQSENSSELKTRLEDSQRQLVDIRSQIDKQNADEEQNNKDLLALESATLRGELDTLSKPQLNVPLVTLTSASALMLADPTRKDTLTPIDVPASAALLTIILPLPPDQVQENYLVELLEYKSGKALWSEKQTHKVPPQSFTLTLARRNLQAGKYRIRISGIKGKKKDPVDHYDLQLNYLSPPKKK